jgi:hypothetical protein
MTILWVLKLKWTAILFIKQSSVFEWHIKTTGVFIKIRLISRHCSASLSFISSSLSPILKETISSFFQFRHAHFFIVWPSWTEIKLSVNGGHVATPCDTNPIVRRITGRSLVWKYIRTSAGSVGFVHELLAQQYNWAQSHSVRADVHPHLTNSGIRLTKLTVRFAQSHSRRDDRTSAHLLSEKLQPRIERPLLTDFCSFRGCRRFCCEARATLP